MSIILRLKNSVTLEFIKEYFSIIVAIPYIIGGIIQFFALTEISMTLVKFFSLSQLLIDGILILVKICGTYFFVKCCSIFFKDFIDDNGNWTTFFYILLLLVTLSLGIYFCYLRIFDPFNTLIFDLMVYFVMGCLMLFSSLFYLIKSISIKLIVVIFFSVLMNIIPSKVSKIENFNTITNELKTKHKNVKLSYFNDQYLFFETDRGKDNNKIIIRKMDDIFDEKEKP